MDIHRLPALADNYIFLLHDRQTNQAAVVDPAESAPVLDCLQKLGADLVAIYNTHHHGDHVGANRELLAQYPRLTIYGGAEDKGRIPGQMVFLQDGDRLSFAGREATIYFVPGHTRGHIAYYFAPAEGETTGDLFCGDTIFAGGCGRLFEGTPAQMVQSIAKLRQLPDQTLMWCAHEYTLGNLKFALAVDPDNQALQARFQTVRKAREQGDATVPSWLGEEKLTNPFLRWDDPTIQSKMGNKEQARVFGKLRGMKDNF
ncbi:MULTISPECIES: hydroxyacylglutathione hydrolase [unclassified Synechocystis]|uniref:hydroxyacylglutathione hydrolase n=1 Tax=unclassified Synechocystis TaxID=2640012 RepID=UPI0003F7B73B|nr:MULTISPECIES: hydroxyacylglutathione hydrolase [unclassified Synechocystis]AIE73706.1 Hydroxyacylglutathione hydrolase [Synechocystis sp. PCC 6714]MCT0252267.1 hydroxyacylglutathione hydrolase [Synechocystis sp. CS-94]